jgi:hypothetical protein
MIIIIDKIRENIAVKSIGRRVVENKLRKMPSNK